MSTSPIAKKRHTQIATHNGCFHADDVIAVAMLKLLPEYQDAQVLRTRDQSLLDKADVVVDVGSKYDPDTLRFDHHQVTFAHTINSLCPEKPWTVRLSSSGLVFHHFGRRLLKQLADPIELTDKQLEKLWDLVYDGFLLEVDGIDNGVDPCDRETKHLYKIKTGISARIGHLNPTWKEDQTPESFLQRFHSGVELAQTELTGCIQRQLDLWLPANQHMSKLFDTRFEVDPSGQIIDIPSGVPSVFASELYEIERERDLEGEIKYYVFEDLLPGHYRVRAMNANGKFELRIGLPAEWRGLRAEALCSIAGLPDCEFVHQSGFIGGALSRETALEMARLSIQMHAESTSKESPEATSDDTKVKEQ
jgi:uncharacterized UPF0160 family protein